jgi:transcriptional regulator with XRE-family HTH domain/AraC-like DNA-binding protein
MVSGTATLKTIEVTPKHIPSRSRLFHLEPVGVGTPFVESLSGYIARLAEKHSVTVAHLFSREIAFHINKPGVIGAVVNFDGFAKAVNGTGVIASDLMDVFERLTLRRDLRFTTMVPWRDVFTRRLLTRETRAWCPLCYEEQYEAGQKVCDQLVWALKAVCACSKHKTPLDLECPYCARRQPHLTFRSRPGHCSSCRAWLGSKERVAAKEATESPCHRGKSVKIAEWVGALLAAAQSFDGAIPPSILAANLSKYLLDRYEGRPAAIARATSVGPYTVRSWLRGRRLPGLDTLLKVCLALDVPPADLICRKPEGEISPARANALGGRSRGAAALNEEPKGSNGKSRRFRRSDWSNPEVLAGIEKELRAALEEYPPRSLTKLSSEIGCNVLTLKRKFPELTDKLAAKSLAYYRPPMDVGRAREALKLARGEEPPPTLNEISRRLGPGHATASLLIKFPEECRFVIERHASRFKKSIDYCLIERILRDSLREYPPPSLAALCRRMGVAEPHVHRRFIELCRLVRRRYVEYRDESLAKRRAFMIQEITSNARTMLRDGVRPTIQSLNARRSVPCGSAHFYRECRRVLSELSCSKG